MADDANDLSSRVEQLQIAYAEQLEIAEGMSAIIAAHREILARIVARIEAIEQHLEGTRK